ncbi:MAG TPA: polyphenol oxidase family protein [Candidatus Paceibacterota bacterium]|nr:polyphenol oxidase family protein [Candidatus Paceibacterota bacterium]
MCIALFLPSEQVKKGVSIPKLAHGSNVVTILTGNEDVDGCDALVTAARGVSLGIRTADCAPVCFSDGKSIGIAHVGWRGLCLGLIEKMLAHFDVVTLSVYVAPFLHSFEIQKDFCYDQITQKFGKQYTEQQSGKLVFNFAEAIGSVLPPQTVYDSRDTAADLSFPSHRRDKTKDRFVTTVSFL